jgi:hypothetical protein
MWLAAAALLQNKKEQAAKVSMLTAVLIIVIIFFLGAVFYKQTIQEYKLNQIEWEQADRIGELFEEGTPFIVRGMPACPAWSAELVGRRPEFKGLTEWLTAAGSEAIMPWRAGLAEMYGRLAHLEPWLDETWGPYMPSYRRWFGPLFPRATQVWAGGRGLIEQKAAWTLLMPTDGTVIATLMSKKEDRYMPTAWRGRFPDTFTQADTAYVGQLKFLDVKLRVGTALFIPAHWKVCWQVDHADAEKMPFMAIINFHTPISRLAELLGSATASARVSAKTSADA